ncbi:MAG TPA: GGDEF domain-containing protein [Pirellulales bacterium]|jgi:diguanylate cyclase (GGDEF)-like protein|nr:GGDEF domain-containing protein [Pirellulales bacterium]
MQFDGEFLAAMVAAPTLALAAGFGLGWYLCARRARRFRVNERQVAAALLHLQDLASRIADDVGKHASLVEQVNGEISSPAVVNGLLGAAGRTVLDAVGQIVIANRKLQGMLSGIEEQLGKHATQLNCQLSDTRVDLLTALPNRQAFDDELGRRFAEWQRTGASFAVAVMEVGGLTKIADGQGAAALDNVLQEAARRLEATMREMDLIARYGQGQFALLLPATKLPEATRAAERARQAVDAALAKLDQPSLEVSAGVAEALPSDNSRTLLRRATAALSVAKEADSKCGYFHDGSNCHPILAASTTPVATAWTMESQAPTGSRSNHYAQYVAALNVDSRTDVLTGLPNRRAFNDELRRTVAESQKNGRPLSVIVVGVDNLARLSARQGQEAVDHVLRKLSQVLAALLRDTDLVTRYGWEEFAVILPGTSTREANNARQRLLTALAACEIPLEHSSVVTITSGVASLAQDDDAVTLCRRADEDMQASRTDSNRSVRFHQPDAADEMLPAEPVEAT